MFKTIIWATDGSDNADRGLALAVGLAQESDCKLIAVHSKELLTGRPGGYPLLADETEIEAKISRQVEEVRQLGIEAQFVVTGGRAAHAARSIAKVATSTGADLIVVGTRGQTPAVGVFLGSVAQGLLHVAPCAVLAVPPATHVERAIPPTTAGVAG